MSNIERFSLILQWSDMKLRFSTKDNMYEAEVLPIADDYFIVSHEDLSILLRGVSEILGLEAGELNGKILEEVSC